MRYIFLLLMLGTSAIQAQDFVKSKLKKGEGLTSEAYQSMTFNGAWCWFSDPRAVYFEGQHQRTYGGWVDNYGDIHVGYYDHKSKEIHSQVIYDSLEIDDHNNPSIAFDSEGHLMVFFNAHMIGEQPLFMVKSEEPESIASWSPLKKLFLNDSSLKDIGSMNHTYTNPVKLLDEDNRFYLFWRGVDGKPSYSTSDDGGESWSTGKIFFMPERLYSFRRPYTKVYSNGKSKIHFIFTDGHPRKENENSIYYACYENGYYHRADGTKIKQIGIEPLTPGELDKQIIDKSKWTCDIHLARNYKKLTDVRFQNNPYRFEWWSWCDALFMGPPSFVEMWKVTGNEKYLDYMDTQWWKTSDYLYSESDSLFFRDDRFFEKRSENGEKIFWARGNGWVIAGLARLLEDLPEQYDGRERFEQQYQEMAHKLLSIQGDDGMWRVSLLDPGYLDIGESSGSAFFTYALAWGINNGMLDKSFQPAIEKAWKALAGNVNEEGRLGYVQQVAGDPYPFYEDQWQVYATGAFLLAGKEMYQLAGE